MRRHRQPHQRTPHKLLWLYQYLLGRRRRRVDLADSAAASLELLARPAAVGTRRILRASKPIYGH